MIKNTDIAIIGGGKSIQVVVALLVQFFHVLAITKFAPYENFRVNCVQFVASIPRNFVHFRPIGGHLGAKQIETKSLT